VSDFTLTPNYSLYKPTVNADVDIWGDHLNANTDTLDALIKQIEQRGTGTLLVTDYLDPGQPDGITDNTGGIQQALDDAAGVVLVGGTPDRFNSKGYASLLFPAAAQPYMVNGLIVPANSHLIIAPGAVLQHNANMGGYILGVAQPPASVTVSATGNTYDSVTGATTLTTTTAHGISVGATFAFWGVVPLHGTYKATSVTTTTLSFYAANNIGAQSITSGIVYPSTGNILIELYGTLNGNRSAAGTGYPRGGIGAGGFGPCNNIYVQGNNLGFITNTLNWPVNLSCCTNGEINGINIDNFGQSVGAGSCEINGHTSDIGYLAVTSGSYVSGTGVMTLTTASPHFLTTGSLFSVTGIGTPRVPGQFSQYNALAGTTGSTLVFNVGTGLATAFTYSAGHIHALSGTYSSATGASTITTVYPHGLVPGNMFTLANAASPFWAHCGQFVAAAGTSGTTIVYTDPELGKTPATFNTGILGILLPSVNSGFVDCTVRNINDLGVIFYGGCNRGYIRDCDITNCGGGAMIFADTNQRGHNYDCEISNCELWGNRNAGAYIGSNVFGVLHYNSIIRGCHCFNNVTGMSLGGANGALVTGNFLHDNTATTPVAPAYTGEINVGASLRVAIVGNTIRDPNSGWTAGPTAGPAYGIGIADADYLYIANNHIGDYKYAKTMTAAIGGSWGKNGLSEGNYYGPRLATNGAFPSDQSYYTQGSKQGVNYDTVTGYRSGMTLNTSVVGGSLVGGSNPAVAIAGGVAGFGLSIGWNDELAAGTHKQGLGETDFYLGPGLGRIGGFNFFQVIAALITSGTYNSTTGAVSLVINQPHTLLPPQVAVPGNTPPLPGGPGSNFSLFGLAGTAAGAGSDWTVLTDNWSASAGTTGGLVSSSGNTYTSGTGVVVLTTVAAHGIGAGTSFSLAAVTGTAPAGSVVSNLNGIWTATSVTSTTITFTAVSGLGALTITGGQVSGTTLAFTAPTGLDITAITGGGLYVAGGDGQLGAVDVTRGISGSILANDGYGNLRLSGALVHGKTQVVSSFANGATSTILPNNSMVLVRNSASIATGTIVLPDPTSAFESYPGAGGFNELEVNFQNPVGSLTISASGGLTVMGGASITTPVATAGASINFIQNGTNWLRRIMA